MVARLRDEPDLPAVRRIAQLRRLSDADRSLLRAAVADHRITRPRRDIVVEGMPIDAPRLIVTGWAARARYLPDGRRQILSFLLPGDLIGLCRQPHPVSVSTVVAITEVSWCFAPLDADPLSGLAQAYAVSAAMEEAYLLRQVARLGRLNAQERIADLLLELHERLCLAGLVVDHGFDMPLTQEVLADALGLTSVHINRTLQLMRRDEEIRWTRGRLVIRAPELLAAPIGRIPVRVCEA